MPISFKKLAKVKAFTLNQWWLLFRSWWLFLKWDILISFVSYKRWSKEIGHHEASQVKIKNAHLKDNAQNNIISIINISEIAGRHHLKKMNCLRRCLVQKQLLAGYGVYSKLHFGVTFEQDKLAAHAWLSFNGKVINDTEDVTERYSELTQVTDKILSQLG